MRSRAIIVLAVVTLMATGLSVAQGPAPPDSAVALEFTAVYGPSSAPLPLYPVADAYVSQGGPTTNFGSATKLDVQNLDAEIPDDRRSYVGFDLSGIPANAIITSAAFKAYLYEAQGLSNVEIQLGRVTTTWTNNAVTWNTQPSSVPYGGIDVGTQARMYGWDVTSLVQEYWVGLDFGAKTNCGLVLRGPASGSYYLRRFYSANSKTDRPYLIISYRLPTPSPTNTSTRTPTRTPTHTPTPTRKPSATPTSTPICPDIYEPNETFADAWPLDVGTYYPYICTPGDEDWFSIDLVRRQELYVSLEELPKNYDLELYDPRGVPVDSSHNPSQTAENIEFIASEMGGAYRIHVFGVGGACAVDKPYLLKLTLGTVPPTPTTMATPTPTPMCATDAYEPNDTFATAAPISIGTEVNAQMCPEDDIDFFRFSVLGAAEIRAHLYNLPQSYQLYLLDPTGSIVARAIRPHTSTEPRELTYATTTVGEYRVKVERAWGALRGSYSLQVDLAKLPPITLCAEADTYVYQAASTTNYGTERVVIVGVDEFGNEYRGLFRFDLSDVPATTIDSATFEAYLEEGSNGPDPQIVNLLRVDHWSSWGENAVTWNSQPTAWDTGISTLVSGRAGYYYQWDVTDLVQSWLSGEWRNTGLELRPADVYFTRSFRSREYGSRCPRLIINFSEPDAGPIGSISGTVYDDANENGRQDSGESGVSGVRLDLFREGVIQTDQTTASDGMYTFDDLPAGGYEVAVDERTIPYLDYELISTDSRSVTLAADEDRGGVDFRVALRPTPTPLPPTTLDLIARDMEFIQVVHDEDQNHLVVGKRTLVRVYVGVTGSTDPVRGVNAMLWRSGHEDDVLEPINRDTAEFQPLADPMVDTVQSNLDYTLNFLLPDDWARTDTFFVHINTSPGWFVSVPECSGCNVNNQINVFRRFHDTATLNVNMVAVTVDGISPTVSRADTYRWLLKTYPITEISARSSSMTAWIDFTDTGGAGCGRPWSAMLSLLWWKWVWEGSPDDVHYYGMIDDSVPHAIPGTIGCGYLDTGNGAAPEFRHIAAGFVTPASDEGGITMAHEIAHNRTRPHTCCSGEGGCVDYADHPGGIIGEYGVDLADPGAPIYLAPDTTFDLMSYCDPVWMSDITYFSLFAVRFGELGAVHTDQSALAAQREYVVGSGEIADGSVTMSQPFYRVTMPAGTSDEQGEGPYTLELQNAAGTPLFTRHFHTVDTCGSQPEGTGPFQEIVPWQAGTAQIVIKENQGVLLVTEVSANPPQVTLLSPNGGESWPPYGEHTVTWTGADADGDPLRYVLQYSPDGGSNWSTVATDLVGESYDLDAGSLPGSDAARLRVIVSDGVNTSQDESDGTFSVGRKPPEPYILYPRDGDAFAPGNPVILEGVGTDLEDGPMTNDADFTWSSSLEGVLGVGRQMYFDDLITGKHTITLQVTDSDGFVGQDSVSIFIGMSVHLPFVLK